LQQFITSYYRWKRESLSLPVQPQFFDFTELKPLQSSAELFYKVGLSSTQLRVLKKELCNLQEFARFIVAHIYSVVAGDRSLVNNQLFVENIDPAVIEFNPALMRKQAECRRPDLLIVGVLIPTA